MKRTLALAGITFLCSSAAIANELSADLNPDAFHIQFDATHATNGIIYSGELLLTADNGEFIAASMLTDGQVGRNTNLSGGFGGKLYLLDDERDSFGALAIGGKLVYTIPEFTDLHIGTELFYAPSITLTGDAESLIDFNVTAEYDMFENASLYAGVRHIETEYEFGIEHEFDSGPFAGISIDF